MMTWTRPPTERPPAPPSTPRGPRSALSRAAAPRRSPPAASPRRGLPSAHRSTDSCARVSTGGLQPAPCGPPTAPDDDLERYCLQVGGGPGLAALPVFGCPDARAFARALGAALQRTNVLRDVAADARSGRVYMPANDLAAAGLTAADLAATHMPPPFRRVARTLARRARAAFASARAAVPPGAERALAPALGMGRVYEALLARLEDDPARAWSTRVRVPRLEAALRGLGVLGGRP